MADLERFPITISLDGEAYDLAQKFASEQTTSLESKQVYRNTLAVWAVNRFLQWMEIDTDLSQGDSWHPVVRRFNDVADLVIPSLGRLECRPVLPGETSVHLPVEVREERIGYIAVQFQEKSNQVQLLGCYVSPETDELPEQLYLKDFNPLDDLLNHLEWLEMVKALGVNDLREWLKGLFKSGWEEDEEEGDHLVVGANSGFRFRKSLEPLDSIDLGPSDPINFLIKKLYMGDEWSRWAAIEKLGRIGAGNSDAITALTKLLEVEQDENIRWQAAFSLRKIAPSHPKAGVKLRRLIKLGLDYPVVLIVKYRSENEGEISVWVQVCSVMPQTHLPTGCKLIVLDECGKVWKEVEAQDKDECIQRQFEADSGEFFGIQVEMGKVSHIENFVG